MMPRAGKKLYFRAVFKHSKDPASPNTLKNGWRRDPALPLERGAISLYIKISVVS